VLLLHTKIIFSRETMSLNICVFFPMRDN
jgi:hypothetical protein